MVHTQSQIPYDTRQLAVLDVFWQPFTQGIFCFNVMEMTCTSEACGVLGRVGAGVCEATGCCDSGCGADNASVLREKKQTYKSSDQIQQAITQE